MNTPTERSFIKCGMSMVYQTFPFNFFWSSVKEKVWWREGGSFPLTCQVTAFGNTGFCVTPMFCGWRRGCWKHSSAHWGSLRRRERKLLFYYKVCQMMSEKMWYHSYALPSWRGAAHLGSHLELTYNSFGLVWALSETAPYAVFT